MCGFRYFQTLAHLAQRNAGASRCEDEEPVNIDYEQQPLLHRGGHGWLRFLGHPLAG